MLGHIKYMLNEVLGFIERRYSNNFPKDVYITCMSKHFKITFEHV